MLLALIIGAAAVVAFICSFDDDNSKRPAGVNRVRSVAEGQAEPAQAKEGPMKTVFNYVNTSKRFGDPDHLKVFANVDAAESWFEERPRRRGV
jgi:hypothetical protein